MKTLTVILSMIIAVPALASLIPPVSEEQPLCYGREYSTSHMEQNPKQKVKRIEAKFVQQPDQGGVLMNLRVDLKKEEGYYENEGKKEYYVYTKPYGNTLFCYQGDDKKYVCAIDCDGGSVGFNGHFGKTLQLINNGVTVEGGCGEETDTVFLSPEKGGDDVFNLHELPKEFCQK